MNVQDFGNYISTRRKELGLSQKDVADFLNISISTVSKYEKGLLYPDLSLMGLLARILKVDLISLVNYESKLNNNYDVENEFDISDVVSISRGTTKQDELFEYVGAPDYLKSRIKDYDGYEKDKDDFEISL